MAETTSIEWTGSTWTPIRARRFVDDQDPRWPERIGWHCEHVSPGCMKCYAESINRRLGTGEAFKPANLKHTTPLGDPRGDVEVYLDEEMLLRPLRWRRPREIFVCSMTDLFAGFVRPEWIDAVFAIAALAPWHTFQVLTKRSDRMRAYLSASTARDVVVGRAWEMLGRLPKFKHDVLRTRWPLPNVHIGVSVEDQRRADERLPDLKAAPAARRFVSLEPLLEPVQADLNGIDLAIIGGESGIGARACHIEWIRSLVKQARSAGCAPFVKQLGHVVHDHGMAGPGQHWPSGIVRQNIPRRTEDDPGFAVTLRHPKGGDMAEWPEDLRVREFPEVR